MIKLFGMSSPNVRKILIALEELELVYDWQHVHVFRGENLESGFRNLSPFAKVPVLVDEAAQQPPLFESGAILLYLGETYGHTLLPKNGPERWAVITWLMAQLANVGPVFGQHSHFRRMPDQEPYAAERFRRSAAEIYRTLDRRLAQTPYLAGETYSIADIATYPWAKYLWRHGMASAECPSLVSWIESIDARPAVIRAKTVFDAMREIDAEDRRNATDEDHRRLAWMHFPAPSAEQASGQ